MSSYVEVLSSLDAEVISSVETRTLLRLIVLLNTEYSKRMPKSPISWLKEWEEKHRDREVEYTISKEEGKILIRNETGDVWSSVIGREPLIKPPKGAGKDDLKTFKRMNQAFKRLLASMALLHIKKEWSQQ